MDSKQGLELLQWTTEYFTIYLTYYNYFNLFGALSFFLTWLRQYIFLGLARSVFCLFIFKPDKQKESSLMKLKCWLQSKTQIGCLLNWISFFSSITTIYFQQGHNYDTRREAWNYFWKDKEGTRKFRVYNILKVG